MQKKSNLKEIVILVTVCVFTLMSTLDSSIVNIALPTICRELNIGQDKGSLIVSSYLLVICCSLLPFGKLGDIYGKSRVFKIGGIVFVIGSLLCGISSSLFMLIVARVIQAIGSGMTMSTNSGIITETFSQETRGRALGSVAAFVSIGAIAGPGLGGFILNHLSWHYIFLINIPIGLVGILSSQLILKNKKKKSASKIDYKGGIILSVLILSFYAFITSVQDEGLVNPLTLVFLLVTLATFYLFIKLEKNIENPLVDLKIFKNKLFSGSLLSALFIFIAAFFYTMIMPFYLQEVKGLNPSQAGMIMMVMPLVQIVFSPIAGILADKYDRQKLTLIGLILLAGGIFTYSFWKIDTDIKIIVLSIAITALGNALFQAPNNTIVMSSVKANDLGIAGALNALARNLGMVVGVAVSTLSMNLLVEHQAGHHVSDIAINPTYFVSAMHSSFLIASVFCLVAIFFNSMNHFNKKQKKISL
ncbi:MFS transporter [Streptococcaceae bacterium ESL0687]|nr:MFS transporter [Streptococcaceae bacterium ESL0687]